MSLRPSSPYPTRPGSEAGAEPNSPGKTARSDASAEPERAERAEGRTLAFAESPAQVLNLLEWAHVSEPSDLTLVVLPPADPMTRGQLFRMVELARDEGHPVRWQEARGGPLAPLKSAGALTAELRRTARLVIGDPFSRYLQVLLNVAGAEHLVVVDDGTATMEFTAQLAAGGGLTRWHRTGRGGPQALLFAPVSHRARRRLTPGRTREVELFSAMPIEAPEGVRLRPNTFAWTRSRYGPPLLTSGSDLVGTSLVETGVVDRDRYLEAVVRLAREHGATRYFAHRREDAEKLQQVGAAAGLQLVRPDVPLELAARRGPVGRSILSFPSTVVHTLPRALAGTPVSVAVRDVDPAWLTPAAAPGAKGFLARVAASATGVRMLGAEPGTASA